MVITVQCSSCDTGFPVDPAKIPAGGVKVRCSACGSIFRVEPPADVATDEAPGDDAGSGSDWFEATDRAATADPGTRGSEAAEFASDSSAAGEPADWVFERDEDVDPDSLEIEPVGTVEETVSEARDESSFFGGASSFGGEAGDDGLGTTADRGAPAAGVEEGDGGDDLPTFEMDEDHSLEIEEPVPPVVESTADEGADDDGAGDGAADATAAPVGGFTFGQRDPKEKAQRLARVLVSDMIMYNPERHERALANGTLKDDFEEEIAKSWKEYVDQVGEDMAESTDFWTEALNDVLARGERIF